MSWQHFHIKRGGPRGVGKGGSAPRWLPFSNCRLISPKELFFMLASKRGSDWTINFYAEVALRERLMLALTVLLHLVLLRGDLKADVRPFSNNFSHQTTTELIQIKPALLFSSRSSPCRKTLMKWNSFGFYLQTFTFLLYFSFFRKTNVTVG